MGLLLLTMRTAIAAPYRIPSGSMTPTLNIGAHILVTRYDYGPSIPLLGAPMGERTAPQRGDVVMFRHAQSGDDYVKRVVGLPGETIALQDGVVSIDGSSSRTALEKIVEREAAKKP